MGAVQVCTMKRMEQVSHCRQVSSLQEERNYQQVVEIPAHTTGQLNTAQNRPPE